MFISKEKLPEVPGPAESDSDLHTVGKYDLLVKLEIMRGKCKSTLLTVLIEDCYDSVAMLCAEDSD